MKRATFIAVLLIFVFNCYADTTKVNQPQRSIDKQSELKITPSKEESSIDKAISVWNNSLSLFGTTMGLMAAAITIIIAIGAFVLQGNIKEIKQSLREEQQRHLGELEKLRSEIKGIITNANEAEGKATQLIRNFEADYQTLKPKIESILGLEKSLLDLTNKINKLSAKDLYDKAQEAFFNKDYDLSYKTFQESLKFNPFNSEAFVYLGRIEYLFGNYNSAIDLLNQAVELSKNKNERAYNHLAICQYLINDFDSAISNVQNSIRLNEKYCWSWATLAEINSLLAEKNNESSYLDKYYEYLEKAIQLGYPIWNEIDFSSHGKRNTEKKFVDLLNKYSSYRLLQSLEIGTIKDENDIYRVFPVGFKEKIFGQGITYNEAFRDLKNKFINYVSKNGDSEFVVS